MRVFIGEDHNFIKFHEILMLAGCYVAGEAYSLKVEKILFLGKSDYQNVIVFQIQLALAY